MSDHMPDFRVAEKCPEYDPTSGQKDIYVQLALSLALGIFAFLGFCILRPKWKSLYSARKRQIEVAVPLPDLPDTFFGWIPVLYRVTEEQVLASAGLDACVFLSFFRMSIKLFGVMFLLTATILAPINKHFDRLPPFDPPNANGPNATFYSGPFAADVAWSMGTGSRGINIESEGEPHGTLYLWAYLVFTYVFTALALYFMTTETHHVIRTRQDYLGSQLTITDRTIRLSGIPEELRSEEKIQEFLENLEIGKVDSVTICRNWKKLDNLMDQRLYTLRRLEEAWTDYLEQQRKTKIESLPITQPRNSSSEGDDDEIDHHEEANLLIGSHISGQEAQRPMTRIWRGFLRLQSRRVDAIDYYEEKLRKLDDRIKDARTKEYEATPLAFVTMDSIPACQMAVQALLDPSPMQLLAKLAPAPSDVVWQNTYLSRSSRMIRSWTISIFIFVLTIFWIFPVIALSGLVDLCSIRQIWPQLADLLESHLVLKALIQTGLPTIVVSLLNLAVPFLYDYLANIQGSVSQGEVELSVISKNFLFTFFNVFLVFTISGTASTFWPVLQKSLKDPSEIASKLATSVKGLGFFYTNFIMLQALGLLPFRLLEFGSVALYPFMLMTTKTPRDYAELMEPPVFKYGFYLPSAILIYILCIVYSILPAGFLVLFFGLIYFVFGYYTYKYQLLYAMDHPQHETGGAWPMICYRILVGLGVFQVVMAGLLALGHRYTASGLVVPLIPFTVWYSYYFGRTYEPLTKYIALRSIRRRSHPEISISDENGGTHRPPGLVRQESITIDAVREKGLKFVNPSLTVPLEKLWINDRPESNTESLPLDREESEASSVSLGDTHIWRDNGDANV